MLSQHKGSHCHVVATKRVTLSCCRNNIIDNNMPMPRLVYSIGTAGIIAS